MADAIRYGKPSLTNLPKDLGKAIFKKILATPAPDRAKMKAGIVSIIYFIDHT